MSTRSTRFSDSINRFVAMRRGVGDIAPRIAWEPSIFFLRLSLFALLAGALGFIAVLYLVSPEQKMRYLGPVIVIGVVLLSWTLLSLKRLKATLHVLAAGTWLATVAITTFTGGVRAPMIIAYPVIIMMIGWLIGTRLAVWVAVLTVMVNVIFVVAETKGFLPTAASTHPAMHGVLQIVIFVLSATLIQYLVGAYLRRLTDLAASQAELERAQAVARIGSWAYDVASDTLRSSSRNCLILGVPEGSTWSSESFMLHIHPDDRAVVWVDWLGLAKGGVFDREHRIMVAGEIRWIRQTAEMAFDADGKPVWATGVTQDVTDRKRADLELQISQARLQQYSDNLEVKVLERTRELDDLNHTLDQRIQGEIAKRKAQESLLIHQSRLAAMGEMIGAIAHQWRQPLNAISLVLQNMRLQHSSGKLTDESMGRMQDKAEQLVQRMSSTIDEFRDLFKPGKRAEAFNLANAIRTTADIMDGAFTSHAITLTIECDESIELVGVRGEFSQVMLNLLSNADDAVQEHRPNSPQVGVKAMRCGDRVRIEVQDNGGGVDPAIIDRIFEPYFTTKKDDIGTGIGLYLSRMIVENNMNGRLTVVNVDGGARFALDMALAPVT